MTASRERQVVAGALYLVPAVVGNLVPLLTLPIFTRILTPVDYGAWSLALAYAAILTGLANFGLTLCYDRQFFEYRDENRAAALLYSLLSFVAVAYALCVAVTWVFREAIAGWLLGTAGGGSLLFWVVCAHGMASLKWYYLAYLRNSGDAKSYVWFTLDETILATAAALVFVAIMRVGVVGLPWGQFIASSVVFVLLSVRFVRRLRPRFSSAMLVESLALAYPLTPRIFLGVLNNQFDKYLLRFLGSVGAVGVYSIGQKVSQLVFAYMTALENVFGPQVYRRIFDMGEEGGRAVGRYLTPFAYASFGIAVLVSLFSEEALIVLTPPEYHGALPIVNLLVLYYAVMFFGKQPQLVYAKKTYLLSVLSIFALAAYVGFILLGIRMFGMVGAAVGTLASGVVGVAVYNVVANRYYRIRWETGKLAAMLGLLVLASLASPLMRDLGVAYALRLLVKLALCGAYAVLGWRLGILTKENLALVRSVIAGKLRRPGATPAGSA